MSLNRATIPLSFPSVSDRMRRLVVGDRLEPCGLVALEHLMVPGKALRAGLAADAARALGIGEEAALAWATCCELLHEASLVHDDIQDGDTTRRGAPTLWARFGVAQAINVGDLLLMLSTVGVAEIPTGDAIRWRLARAVAEHAVRAARGQALDLAPGWKRLRWTDWEEAASGKSGALFALPVDGAALLAGATRAEAAARAAPFTDLGVLLQLQNDVADLFGDDGHPGADVRSGRKTALLAQHLELCPSDAGWLREQFESEPVDEATIRRVCERFRDAGTVEEVIDRAYERARRILDADLGPLRPLALQLLDRILAPLRAFGPSLPEVW